MSSVVRRSEAKACESKACKSPSDELRDEEGRRLRYSNVFRSPENIIISISSVLTRAHRFPLLAAVAFQPKGEAVVETSLTDKDRGLKYTFKGDISKKGDLGVEYTKGMLGLTATMDLFEQKKFSTTALVSQNAFAVGGSANLKTSGGVTLDTFSVGASYSTGPFFAALTTTKLSSATLAVKYEVSDTLKVVTSSEHR